MLRWTHRSDRSGHILESDALPEGWTACPAAWHSALLGQLLPSGWKMRSKARHFRHNSASSLQAIQVMLWSISVVSAAWRHLWGRGWLCQLAPPVWVRVKLCFCCSLFPQSPPRPRDFLPLHRSVSAVTKHSEDSGADPILNILLSSFLQNIFIEHLLMLSIGDRAANTADTVSVLIEFISL